MQAAILIVLFALCVIGTYRAGRRLDMEDLVHQEQERDTNA